MSPSSATTPNHTTNRHALSPRPVGDRPGERSGDESDMADSVTEVSTDLRPLIEMSGPVEACQGNGSEHTFVRSSSVVHSLLHGAHRHRRVPFPPARF